MKKSFSSNTLLLSATSFLFALLLLIKIYIAFSYTSDLAGIEEATFYNIHKIFVYGKLYCTSPNDFPYTITPHTPLYYYFITTLAKLFFTGNQSEMYSLYVFGRLVSLFFVSCAMVLMYKSIAILTKDKMLAYLLVIISFLSLDNHVFSMRPDGLKLLNSCLYLYFIILYLKYANFKFLFILACIVSVGFFIKQDEILISVVGSIILLQKKKIKELIMYNLIIFLIIIILNFFLYKYEPYYFDNIFYAVAELKGFTHFLEILHIYFIYKFYFLFILLLLIFLHIKNKPWSPLFVSTLALFLFAVIISNKWGSSTVYYTDFQLVSILCLSLSVQYIKQEFSRFFILTLLILCSFYEFYKSNMNYIEAIEINKINFQKKEKLASYIKLNFITKPGEYYYCLDPSFNIFLPDNQLLGAIHTNDIWVYAKFKYKMEGKVKTPFDDIKFLKDLNSTKVRYLIINNDNYIKEKFSKLHTCKYEIVFENDDFIVYQNL